MKLFFYKYKLSILILILSLLPNFTLAQVSTCSPVGYSIFTINGINTNKDDALNNKDTLQRKLFISEYKNEPLAVDFLYNPSHGKIIDLLDSGNQRYWDKDLSDIQDSDFAQMLTDASTKVKTQKLLLVGHSQGNFYANSFYNAVVEEPGGIPSQSMGVYAVATPANRISGVNNPDKTNYTTSYTDRVIVPLKDRLTPNVHINFKPSDDDSKGHSFSKIYLTYEGDKIVRDIESALNKLKNNNIQNESAPCITPPKLTLTQKVQSNILAFVDHPIRTTQKAGLAVRNKVIQIASNIYSLAKSLASKTSSNSATVILADNPEPQNTLPEPEKPTKENSQKDSNAVARTSVSNTEATPSATDLQARPVVEAVSSNPVVSNPVVANFFSGGGSGPAYIAPPENVAPVISIIGINPITVESGSIYTDAGATALDDIDGVRTVNTSGAVNTSVLGTYTITYTATDLSGNVATTTRTINVVAPPPPDTTAPNAPIITTLPQSINTNSIIIVGTAETNSTINITGGAGTATGTATGGNYSISVTLNQNTVNTLSVTATDAANNTSNPIVLLITHDNIAPTISRVFFASNIYIQTNVVGSTLQLNIVADASGYTLDSITVNDIPVTEFQDNLNGMYTVKRIVALGETDRSGGSIPVSVVLKDTAGNTNTAYTAVEGNGLALNGHAPVSVFQGFPTFASDGKFTQDVVLDCITDSGNFSMYHIRDSDSIFGFINTNSFSVSCPGGHQTFVSKGSGFEDFPGYPIPPIAGWYHGAVSVGTPDCDLSSNGKVCVNTHIQSFFRLHRSVTGIWSDSTPTLVSAKVTSATAVDLTFSKDLNGQTVTNADFTIVAHALASPDAFEITPGVVRLTISDTFASGETPEIIYNTTVSNGVKDLAGNVAPGKTIISTSSI